MIRRASLLPLITLLAACQTPVLDTDADAPASVQALINWNLGARMGYRANDDGGSASLDWRQRDDRGEIHFSGPLGLGSAEIRWHPGEALLTTGKEQVRATDTTSLAWRLTGLWLPVEALEYWVRGLPYPDAEFDARRDEAGQLQTLEQLGWQLEFSRYQAVNGHLTLPHKIRAHRDAQRFTLVVQDWEPLP